jgi:CheY-like chemotaxis protein
MRPDAYHILVIDDDANARALLRLLLEQHGYSVLLAPDGEVGLSLAEMQRPDVILLDVAMPRLDGRDALRALKDSPSTRGIPVLVVSALGGDQTMRDLLLELGAWDVLEKPVDLQMAFNKAERLVQR